MKLFGSKKRNEAPSSKPPANPYLPALRAWDDINGFAINRMQRSDMIATIFGVLSVIFAIGMVYYASQPRFIPYVVQVNKLDQALAVTRAEQMAGATTDPTIVRAAIKLFVESVRTVTFDPIMQKRLFTTQVRPMVASGSQAEQFLTNWLQNNDPFKRAKSGDEITPEGYSVEVTADSPIMMSENTFQDSWSEKYHDAQGNLLKTTYWTGFFTVTTHLTGDEQQLMLNPIGLYVTNISWSQQTVMK
jgi:type IV secretion system protein VirB5